MWPSGNGTTDTQMQGTTTLAGDDHSLNHRQVGSVINQIGSVFGTTPGTNLLRNVSAASDQLIAANSGGTLKQTFTKGTFNNAVMGSQSATGGTFTAPTIAGQGTNSGTVSGGMYGTASIQGGTIFNPTIQVWNGWMNAGETPTVLGTTLSQGINIGTLQVASGATSKYDKGDKVNFTQGGTNMYMSIYSVPSGTTILVTGGTDYVPGTTAITNFLYSKAENPNGFPGGFNFTPNETYSGTAPTTVQNRAAKFWVRANQCFFKFYASYTTGGSTSALTINQPIPGTVSASIYHTVVNGLISSADNSNSPNTVPQEASLFSNTLISMGYAPQATKASWFQGFYEI